MLRTTLTSAVLGAAALSLVAGCPTRKVSNLSPHNEPESVKEIPVDVNRNVDILFVIDNSGSMSQEQTSLANNFPRFINVLETIEGGLPNVHIGIVSSNVGISPYQTTGCVGQGDDGKFQNVARGACTPPSGYYIIDVKNPDGTETKNFPDTTTLEDVFSCVAKLGTSGCGLEQHLESMKRGLDGHRPENANFLRPDAYLAIIFVQDEDDCSAKDSTVFDPSQNDLSDPLGPFGSFRCTEFGIECDGAPIGRGPGMYQNCEPMEDTPTTYIWHPQHYVDFLRSIKPDFKSIIVAGIIGNPTPVNVNLDADGNPELAYSCGDELLGSAAVPAVRMKWFLDQFPDRNTWTSICNEDLSDALNIIAQLLKRVIGNPCLDGQIDTTDIDPSAPGVQLDCQISDVLHYGEDNEQSTVIQRCPLTEVSPGQFAPAPGAPVPCWWVSEDPATCSATATQLLLNIERNGADPPNDTTVVARCVAE